MLSDLSRLKKGAIIGIDRDNVFSSVTIFQYNPTKLSRDIKPQTASGIQGDQNDTLRIQGSPVETISVEISIDAADQMNEGDLITEQLGIYPQLSALEMLVYPKSQTSVTHLKLMLSGVMKIIPEFTPLTIFVWGNSRVLPVRITSFNITEQAHDSDLNPIRASVSLGLQVLRYEDFKPGELGGFLSHTHHVAKEAMAMINTFNKR